MLKEIVISKSKNSEDLTIFFDGNTFPNYHPESYFNSRIRDERIYIAKINDQICGFLIYEILWGNAPMIELVKVLPEYKGQGIGRLLMEYTIKHLKQNGFSMLMSSSETDNSEGNPFHEAMGFSKQAVLDMWHGAEQFYSLDLKGER